MSEYCIFQKDFDPFLYLQKPLYLNKDFNLNSKRFVEYGAQIPSKFSNNFTIKNKIDHGFLNCLSKHIDHIYIYSMDYLTLLKFLNPPEFIHYGICYGGKLISKYVCDLLPNIARRELLIHSVFHDNYESTFLLLQKGIDLQDFDEESEFLMTPLEAALENLNFKIAEVLINFGFSIYPVFRSSNLNLDVLKFAINYVDDFQRPELLICLNSACSKNNYEISKLLIESGVQCDINECLKVTFFNKNPNYQLVKYLTEKSPNLNDSYLFQCCCSHKNIKLAELFIKNGFNVEEYGDDALYYAIERSDLQFVSFLLKNGVKITQKSYDASQKSKNSFIKMNVKKIFSLNEK